jgi:hypothetical protein
MPRVCRAVLRYWLEGLTLVGLGGYTVPRAHLAESLEWARHGRPDRPLTAAERDRFEDLVRRLG